MAGARFNVVEDLTLERNALAGVELCDADDGRNGNTIRDNDFARQRRRRRAARRHREQRHRATTSSRQRSAMAVHLIDASRNRIEGNEVNGIPIDPNLDSDGGVLLEGATDNVHHRQHARRHRRRRRARRRRARTATASRAT